MVKRWLLTVHPDYFSSLRRNVIDPDERYQLVNAIFDTLQETDDPTEGANAVPERPGRYELKLRGYLVVYYIPNLDGNKITLIMIE